MPAGSPREVERPEPCGSFLGVGPLVATPAVLYLGASWAARAWLPSVFKAGFPPALFWYGAGGVLVVPGILGHLRSLKVLRAARARGSFARHGPYARARHPAYSAWLFYVLPGLSLLSRSWPGLGTPLVFYAAFRAFIGREERTLLNCFGAGYATYRKRTPLISPLPF